MTTWLATAPGAQRRQTDLVRWFNEHTATTVGPVSALWPTLSSVDLRALGLVVLGAVLMFALKQGIVRTILVCAAAGLLVGYL